MTNKRLNATITIGGAITGALKSALGTTRDRVNEIGKAITNLKDRQRELGGVVTSQERLGVAGSALKVQYAQQELGIIGRQIEALRRKQTLETAIGNAAQRVRDMRDRTRTAMFEQGAGALAIGGLMRAPLKAFEELDAAMNNMEIAMTNSTGKLPEQFNAIKRQTVELGNLLPGTTADFVNLASALKEQGMPMEAIVGGALKSAAHLSVIMKMVPEQAGEMVAKLRESFGLVEKDFGRMADYTQRARFGFGMKSDDLLLGAKYYGGKLNSLGITGADNVRRIYAIQGMAAQQSMDGSTFGTNFSMMLTRVGLMTERLHKNSKEMKAVNAELQKAGVNMVFFDKKGQFAGVDNMVAQLDKMSVFSQEKRLQILTRIFGEEGGRIAELIARQGVKGYQEAMATMDAEASLDQRIKIAVSSFRNQIEALGGTVTNFLAAVGKPLAEMFTPVMARLNEIVGGPMMTFVEQNQTLVKVVGGMAAGSAGLLAFGAAMNAVGFLGTFAAGGLVKFAAIGARVLGMFGGLGGVVTSLAAAVRPLALAFVIAGAPMWAVVAAGSALAAAGLTVYKYWEPIKAFFSGFGEGIAAGLAPVGQLFTDAFGPVWNVLKPLVMPVLETIGGWVKSAAGWFGELLTPIAATSETTRQFGEAGRTVGDVVAAAFRLILKPVTAVLEAIKWINDNIDGVIAKAGQVGDLIGKGWQDTKGFFGFGKPSAPAQPGPGPAVPGLPAGGSLTPPSIPPMAQTVNNSPTVNDNRQFNYTVNAAPGQDAKGVADEVQRRQRAADGARRGGALYDHALGY